MADLSSRPYEIRVEDWEHHAALYRQWLRERGGIVVYENHMFDSSYFGDRSFMPARYIAEEDGQLHDAPTELRPNGGLPSLRQQRIDHIKVEDFDGDVEKCMSVCFVRKEPTKEAATTAPMAGKPRRRRGD